MTTDREIEAAYQAVKESWTYFPCDEDEWKEVLSKALQAAEQARWLPISEAKIEIDTMVKDSVTAYLKRYITHADEVLLNRAPLSKGQLLRYVQHQRDAAETGLKEIEELYLPTPPEENE